MSKKTKQQWMMTTFAERLDGQSIERYWYFDGNIFAALAAASIMFPQDEFEIKLVDVSTCGVVFGVFRIEDAEHIAEIERIA